MEIKDKRVVITGANRGLGRALALGCLRAGAREVVACARRLETIESIKADAGDSAAR
jgi:NAD(P)-dependent dehydrogenase (short-subunit alcohol dehydrogenase family)